MQRGADEAGLHENAVVLENPMEFEIPDGFVMTKEHVELIANAGTQWAVSVYGNILRGCMNGRRTKLVNEGTMKEDAASTEQILEKWESILYRNLETTLPDTDLRNSGIDFNYLLIQK